MPIDELLDRFWAAAAAAAAVTVLSTSAVGLNLWILSGLWANAMAVIYIVVMAAVAGAPDELNLHRIALPLSALFWGGRAAAFAELVVTEGRTDLWGAVAERGAIFAAILTLHLLAARRIGHVEALADYGIELDRG